MPRRGRARVADPRRRARAVLARRADFRIGRGAVVGLTVLGLAAAGHAAGGGSADAAVLPWAGLAAVLAGVALSDREWTLARLLVVLAAGQALIHVLLGLGHVDAGHATGHPLSAGMVSGHAAALLVTALLLRGGEDAMWRVASALGSPLYGTLSLPTILVPERTARLGPDVSGPVRRDPVRHAVLRRGPPLALPV